MLKEPVTICSARDIGLGGIQVHKRLVIWYQPAPWCSNGKMAIHHLPVPTLSRPSSIATCLEVSSSMAHYTPNKTWSFLNTQLWVWSFSNFRHYLDHIIPCDEHIEAPFSGNWVALTLDYDVFSELFKCRRSDPWMHHGKKPLTLLEIYSWEPMSNFPNQHYHCWRYLHGSFLYQMILCIFHSLLGIKTNGFLVPGTRNLLCYWK